jgi:hypothetical protein
LTVKFSSSVDGCGSSFGASSFGRIWAQHLEQQSPVALFPCYEKKDVKLEVVAVNLNCSTRCDSGEGGGDIKGF